MSTALKRALSLIGSACLILTAQNYGRFEGRVVAEWNDDGRTMRLAQPFKYIDPKGGEWLAPAGATIDGASIPRAAWTFMGGPFEGTYRNASVIHDVACVQRKRTWEQVHYGFFLAMLAGGVTPVKAKIMYKAVYHFGPRWANPYHIYSKRPPDVVPPTLTESEFNRMAAEIESKGEDC
jgi:hypothetical protein